MPKVLDRVSAFWARVDRSGDCWLWTGACARFGYGTTQLIGKQQPAHRVAWQLTNGPIPDGLVVRHTCDNPPCCNPAHLLLGTQAENIADKVRKGRQARGATHGLALHPERRARGERHGQAKLTAQQVGEIRRRYQPGRGRDNYKRLGREFGVSDMQIRRIVAGESWAA